MSDSRPNPTAIMQLATGYWNSAALLAASDLRLFNLLADRPLTAQQAADCLQTPLRGVQMLLDACAALELLHKQVQGDPATYANTPAADAYLVAGRPGYLGDALAWSQDQYAAWGQLAGAVRNNQPAAAPDLHLGADDKQTRRFVLGMHNRALGVARGVLHFLPLERARRVLDVGGGPAAYAVLLAQKYPHLHVTVLDLPGVVRVAEELIAQEGCADRVGTQAGNATTADYGRGEYDGVLMSGVLHQMDAKTIAGMLARAYDALQPGGTIVISDVMTDDTATQPPFATLFALQMLLTSQAGHVFTASACVGWLHNAGFTDVQTQPLPPPLPYTVVSARKPLS